IVHAAGQPALLASTGGAAADWLATSKLPLTVLVASLLGGIATAVWQVSEWRAAESELARASARQATALQERRNLEARVSAAGQRLVMARQITENVAAQAAQEAQATAKKEPDGIRMPADASDASRKRTRPIPFER